ncbi:MAG: DUF3592 domain-containing protein [Planctomycetaceae bacterium]|jgi:hypothetical protein|nr:DUF3592 domain-containing protein [Planctomycetaceae bacterium]
MSKITSDVLPDGKQTLSDQVLTFDAMTRHGVKFLLLICAGVLVLTGMVCLFTFMKQLESIISRESIDYLFSILSWVMIVIIVWMIVLMRKVRRVIIDSNSVTIQKLCWSEQLKYTYIEKVRCEPANQFDFLLLLDWNGKELGRIPIKMSSFTVLKTELLQRIQNASDERIKIWENILIEKRRTRRRKLFWSPFIFFVVILFGCFFLTGYWDFYTRGQMRKYGTSTIATIKRLDINSEKTPESELWYGLVEYVFTVNDKEYTRRVKLYESEWIKLQEEKTMEIRYLPDNPNINRPERGEWFHRHHWSSKLMGIFFGACVFLFGTFGFVLALFGYTLDTHNGIIYLLKHDQILEDRLEKIKKV